MKKNRLKLILSFALVALIAAGALTGCKDKSPPDASGVEARAVGEGETVFRFEVTDGEENVFAWSVSTGETAVGAALFGAGLIKYDDSGMVAEVNGLTADWDADQAYWAFYVNGEYAVKGVDETDIEPDKTYAFVYTKG
ncbi:MAG: DUF4430 domain-containing protein [Oscillospiraceae bacterium]|jgi:hypothetical protein|nr:DUF4430 domain-containing protein [Oscillospiraceae bacterium]